MRHYETIFIINPDLADGDYKDVYDKYCSLLDKLNGVLIKSQEWGKQRLAYDIRKHDKGFYAYIDYCADAGVTAEYERALKLDDNILKFQTIKLAEKADPEELLRREKEASEKAKQQEILENKEDQTAREPAKEDDSEVENGISG